MIGLSFYPQDTLAIIVGGQPCPKARDKLVHSGISVPGATESDTETPASPVFPLRCGNDP